MESFPSAPSREALTPRGPRRSSAAHARAGVLLGAAGARGITGLQLLDVRTYLAGDLLFKADIASMAHSLELRAPLLDHRLAELALGAARRPPDSRGGRARSRCDGRSRRPAAGDPRAAQGRLRRAGRAWFRKTSASTAADLLLDAPRRRRGQFRPGAVERLLADHAAAAPTTARGIWTLLMLELWQREYVDEPRSCDSRTRETAPAVRRLRGGVVPRPRGPAFERGDVLAACREERSLRAHSGRAAELSGLSPASRPPTRNLSTRSSSR